MGVPRVAVLAALALIVHLPAKADPQRLSGIVVAGGERVAIFAGDPGAPMLAVREGDVLGQERVVWINPHGVQLDGPAGTRLVTPGDDALTRTTLAPMIAPLPMIDPYRRERETENDQ